MVDTKIVFYEVEDWVRSYLKEHGFEDDKVVLIAEPLREDNAYEAAEAEVVSVFVYSFVDKRVLDKLSAVRLIATRSTGYDHIDLKECKRRGITVSNVPRYGENTVAEHAFALILALSRKLKPAVFKINQLKFDLEGLRGFDLKDKTLGVIGAGAIGLHSIRIGRGFGMRVLAFDKYPQPILAEVLGFEYAPLERVLGESDVITLHVPLVKDTYHLINMDTIHQIKRGAILVNTSRGAVVQTEALVVALDVGILSGAGLDVLEGEESIKEEAQLLSDTLPVEKLRAIVRSYALLHRDNVIITPHVAFYSAEAERRIIDTTIDNINSFLEGSPRNIVKPA
ncbi:MAG: hydroxyacid dehydrogenase [Armatimonadetes bacterium]|nr:hydroxyacid dehydrogenase [Armatimonadota bacterium]